MKSRYTSYKNSGDSQLEMTSTSAIKNSTKYFEPSTSFDQSKRNNFLTNNDVKIQQPEWDMFRLLPPKSDGIEDGILITLHYLSF